MEFNVHHYHHHDDPDPEVRARLEVIEEKLDLILKDTEFQMSQADDLNNMVTALTTGYAALHDAVQVETDALNKANTDLAAAIAKGSQPDPALAKAAADAIANITAITGGMATQAAALTKAVPAATTVPPPVVEQPATPPTADIPVIATPAVTDPAATPPSTPPASATTPTI